MWEPAVSGMEKAHNCADLSYRRIRRYLVWRLKRLEARDFSRVRIKFLIHKGLFKKFSEEALEIVNPLAWLGKLVMLADFLSAEIYRDYAMKI